MHQQRRRSLMEVVIELKGGEIAELAVLGQHQRALVERHQARHVGEGEGGDLVHVLTIWHSGN